ncbi:ATP-dependent DNA helicase DinG [Bacillus sp. UMB0728]|uniref:ATP-dependent DNA helicase DinG n=1 Tax=Bacillus sp. UMB0728 TaxID=2066052 RepID=UPI000C769D2B|nr:ATP-dependent DNA helicase DinG [Bacillus sp. UMB0728]PLR72407.1 ATP-dependent helicase DinG [Bacillus sp. UMB0728]
MSNKYVVVDLETTGNSAKKGDKIIQFAAVVMEGGKIIDQYSSLLNPGKEIPAFIEELTGLNDSMVSDAPVFAEIAPKVMELLEDAYFVAHNVLFDLSFLQEELLDAGFPGFYGPVIDTVELARTVLPCSDSYKLSDLSAKEGIMHDRPHQADSDAYATAKLLHIFLERLEELPLTTIKQLLKLSGGLKSDLDLILEDILLKKQGTAERLPEGIEIHNGIAIKAGGVLEAASSRLPAPVYPAGSREKEDMLKNAFPDYELRPGQLAMMDAVYQSFLNNEHTLVEAGTGTGKTLGYLLPAIIFARQEGARVLISTYTVQLQEQLLSKDLPLLEKLLGFPANAVLLKGRKHYLSLARFEQSLNEADDNYDTTLTKMQILVWLTETATGDVDELNLSSGGAVFWNKIQNGDSKFISESGWKSRDFYNRARKSAENADLIITNHAMLLNSLSGENQIFPSYDYAVIDEGHQFSKAAGKHFGFSIDYLSLRLLLGKIGLYDQKQLLYKLERLLEGRAAMDGAAHPFELNRLVADLQYEMDEFFKLVGIYGKRKLKARKYASSKISFRLTDITPRDFKAVEASAERFSFLVLDLISALEDRLQLLVPLTGELAPGDQALLEEISACIGELRDVRESIRKTIFAGQTACAVWVELDGRAMQNATTVYSQPITVAGNLRDGFFNQKKSAVITSATLSVGQSFDYIMDELGLDRFSCQTELIESPFDYASQVRLAVPSDLPEINSVPLEEYVSAITEHIISLAEAAKGRMLILFTSHDMLRRTYELVKESGFLEEYVLIAQGITSGSRTRLTRNFQRFDKSILFGTSSFWEGVDIPGEDLSCLVMVRLPFSPPDEPLGEARKEAIQSRGGRPFSEHALPEAVLRFKQGVGRLIRTKNDRGIIIVFDRRIVTASYGRAFLDSIPSIPVKVSPLDAIVDLVEDWLQ